MTLHKDIALDRLAQSGNVAQFVAYRPDGRGGLAQTTSRVAGREPNVQIGDPAEAAAALLATSTDRAVNVRSYLPDDPRSREFVYGLRTVEEAVEQVRRLGGEGLHLILNETVDVNDGGVSGVAQGDLIEFAPDDTPRAVEKPGVVSLPRDMGVAILRRVYGFEPDLPVREADRVEFSVHPAPRGWRQTNTLLWELEESAGPRTAATPRWPNRFSRHIGDKVFGLLVAEALGEAVPATTVVGRRVAPFTFGQPTTSRETWIRTAPREPEPGFFTTARGWRDPFGLLAKEDPEGRVSSVLAQAGVPTGWSGAAIVGAQGSLIVEGRQGSGDALMLGIAHPQWLPEEVDGAVRAAHRRLSDALGPVRIEWVHDGERVWIVQLHVGATETTELAIVPGEADEWIDFDVSRGLSELRALLGSARHGTGISLRGEVGLTSHVADVIRKAGLPARMFRK
jgi:hypothetical protein